VDRKAQAKELRRARGLYDEYMRQAAVVRAEARAKDRKADQLECNAWNAVMFCGGPAQPSPTIATALNAGYDRLEVRCNRCGRLSRADLAKVRRPRDTPLHLLEAALFCKDCSQSKKWKQRAHIVALACDTPPDAEPPKRALPRGSRG
jgi:phage terminase large subunit GpA-like protein